MKKTFLQYDKSILTVMVQARTPQRTKELMDRALVGGAEAFGVQLERFLPEYRNRETYQDLFSYTDKPVYVTNYRSDCNEGKSDDVLAEELLELSVCGATLCDVMGDLFDRQPDELAVSPKAVDRQMKLIDSLHQRGAEVLISSHVLQYTPGEKVLEIALQHQRRGADISKIVTAANTMEQQLENLKTIHLLKENLAIPFLFLAGGECRIHRKIGGELGCCMYLCVNEHDDMATPQQPLLSQVKAIRDNI